MMSALLLLVLIQTRLTSTNELCHDSLWNIIAGNWSYNPSNCILKGYNPYYNETTWIWFGEGGPRTDKEWETASYDPQYANRYYRLELQFKMNINLPDVHPSETPHTGVVWKVSRVSPQHNVGQAYYAGLRTDGQYRFGTINDGWTNLIDRDLQELPGMSAMTIPEIVSATHILRVDIIGSIYRLYLNNTFSKQSIQIFQMEALVFDQKKLQQLITG